MSDSKLEKLKHIYCFLAFSTVIACGLLAAQLWPTGPYYLIVSPSFEDHGRLMDLIGAGNGVFVREGTLPGTVIAYSTHADFTSQVMKAGAVAVLGAPIVRNCGV